MRTRFTLFIVAFLTLTACQRQVESVFEKTPTQRIEVKEKELEKSLLASPNGYKVTYFPNDRKFGGFLFFMKFKEGGVVEMTSNVDDDTAITSSHYKVQFGSTVELNFESYNHIHKLSDSDLTVGGSKGKGYESNSTFQYQKTEDGKIYFKEYRRGADFILEPVEDMSEWDAVNQLKNHTSPIENYFYGSEDSSVFHVLTTDDGNGNAKEYNLSYSPNEKYVRLEGDPRRNSGPRGFGLAYDLEGFDISPPLVLERGVTLSRFEPDDADNLVSQQGTAKATISFSEELPKFAINYTSDLTNFSNKGLLLQFLSTYYGTNKLQSVAFTKLIDTVDESTGYTLYWVELMLKPNDNAATLLFYLGRTIGSYTYKFTYEIKDKLLFLKFVSPATDSDSDMQSYFQLLIDFLVGDKGLYFVNLDEGFNTNKNSYSSPSGTITSLSSPNLRAYLYIGK